jgi:hypothetical protein
LQQLELHAGDRQDVAAVGDRIADRRRRPAMQRADRREIESGTERRYENATGARREPGNSEGHRADRRPRGDCEPGIIARGQAQHGGEGVDHVVKRRGGDHLVLGRAQDRPAPGADADQATKRAEHDLRLMAARRVAEKDLAICPSDGTVEPGYTDAGAGHRRSGRRAAWRSA